MNHPHKPDALPASGEPWQQLWHAQALSPLDLSADELRRRSSALQSRVARRNRVEYLAGGLFVIPVYAFYIWLFPFWLTKLGALLVVLGTLVVLQQLQRRASCRALPPEALGQDWAAFHRAELLRQRDAVRSVWLWYIGPLLPGFWLFLWGRETELAGRGMETMFTLTHAAALLLFIAIVALNLRAARRYQREIDALDRQFAPAPADEAPHPKEMS
ncbi:hypothetical protein C1O66_15020 [Paucibacter aquatile]|uniref:Uncharacterized protein n=1 Tax=Kinneretia aquatilis TaxID=2070761 RepID=A0A2N8KZ37_9BURK|nr:hypothetical protein [Paucibacter aquatile]PND38705.1 hypothetical protein C1O66_15020 [Paucibacter aquatile]